MLARQIRAPRPHLMTKQEAISKHIAHAIVRNTRKRFGSLYADALENIKMSNSPSSTTTSMNVADTPAARIAIGREIPDSPASLAAASPAKLTPSPSTDSINGGMSVGSQLPAPVAVPVDANHLEGSNKGDHRVPAKDGVTAALAQAADNGGPRQSAGQFKGSKFETQPPFVSTANVTEETGA